MDSARIKKKELDMTTGNVFGKIIAFAIPFACTAILQLLFNSADMIVVGRFVGPDATGAVGSTGSLNNLIISVALGFSTGAGVVLSSAFGAKNREYAGEVLHTAMSLSAICGILLGIIGHFFAGTFLELMGTPEALLGMATTYLKIIFLGLPFNMVYNFGASMLRAIGDTKRPLIFLTAAGIINVIVNIITVVLFGWGVAGVAIATVASQAVSSICVVIALVTNKGFIKLSLRKLKMHKRAFADVIRLGLPTGIQSSLFGISNVLLQSAINSFDSNILSNGSAIAGQIEGYVYAVLNSISNTALTAVGQNYGARDFKRIKKVIWQSTLLVTVVTLVVGWLAVLANEPLCKLFLKSTGDPEIDAQIVGFAFERMLIMCGTYFLDGIMEVMSYSMRSMGWSISSMIIVLVGTCLFRIIWIYCIFPFNRTLTFLLFLYPLSWILTATVAAVVLVILFKKSVAREAARADLAQIDKVSA